MTKPWRQRTSECSCRNETSLTARKNVDKVMKIALNGTPRQAKFAARYMSYCGQDDASGKLIDVSRVPDQILTFQAILGKLEERDEDFILTHLRALCELALSSPKALEARAEEVHEFVMREVIHQKSTSSEVSERLPSEAGLTSRTTLRTNGRRKTSWTLSIERRLSVSAWSLIGLSDSQEIQRL